MSHSDQSALDGFFARDAPAAAQRELLSATHFTDECHDGRDSVAVVSLLEDLCRWRRGGLAITAVAYDVAMDEGLAGAAREAAMAERIAAPWNDAPERASWSSPGTSTAAPSGASPGIPSCCRWGHACARATRVCAR